MKWKDNPWNKIFSIVQREEVKGLLYIVHMNL